ncbi:MAG: rsbW [Bacillota bacterium]|jgi:serine/threonine-protein kinase RsbW|nr:rsbW [Bacillota bacterium]
MEIVKLEIPKKSEYISTIRLTTSALSNIIGFNIDDIEDIKVIISEICTFFISNIKLNEKPLLFEFISEVNSLNVTVTDLNDGEITEENKKNSEMCILIIESLADDYNINLVENKLNFKKFLK